MGTTKDGTEKVGCVEEARGEDGRAPLKGRLTEAVARRLEASEMETGAGDYARISQKDDGAPESAPVEVTVKWVDPSAEDGSGKA
jgi:hypothetical protein